MRTQCTDRVHAIVVLQKKAGLVLGSNLVYSGWEFSLQLDNQSITTRNRAYKKLSYRRGTARCVVSIEILPIATQQCRNYLKLNSTTRTRHRPDTDRTRTKSAHVVEYELNSTTRTRTDFVGDPHGPNGVSPQKKSVRVRAGPVGSVSGPCRVRSVSGPCSGI